MKFVYTSLLLYMTFISLIAIYASKSGEPKHSMNDTVYMDQGLFIEIGEKTNISLEKGWYYISTDTIIKLK